MTMKGAAMTRGFRAVLLAVVVTVACAGLAACTNDGPSLPTLDGTSSSLANTDLEAVAKAYLDCMADGGVPMQLSQNNEKRLTVVMPSDFDWYLSCDLDGTCLPVLNDEWTGGQLPDELDEALRAGPDEPTLLIDGTDHSDLYVRCLSETGYSYGAAMNAPTSTTRLDDIRRQVDSNNRWASCARDNGWPGLEDSPMPTDAAYAEAPSIILPVTITEDQLRALLVACPHIDPDLYERLGEWREANPGSTGYPEGYLPDPSIVIEAPYVADPLNPTSQEQAQADHIKDLYQVLAESVEAYQAERHTESDSQPSDTMTGG